MHFHTWRKVTVKEQVEEIGKYFRDNGMTKVTLSMVVFPMIECTKCGKRVGVETNNKWFYKIIYRLFGRYQVINFDYEDWKTE